MAKAAKKVPGRGGNGDEGNKPDQTRPDETKNGPVDVLVVVGPAKGRWRAGMKFGPTPQVLPIVALRPDELAAIENDPELTCARETRAPQD